MVNGLALILNHGQLSCSHYWIFASLVICLLWFGLGPSIWIAYSEIVELSPKIQWCVETRTRLHKRARSLLHTRPRGIENQNDAPHQVDGEIIGQARRLNDSWKKVKHSGFGFWMTDLLYKATLLVIILGAGLLTAMLFDVERTIYCSTNDKVSTNGRSPTENTSRLYNDHVHHCEEHCTRIPEYCTGAPVPLVST